MRQDPVESREPPWCRFTCEIPVLGHMLDPQGRLYVHRLQELFQELGYRASAERGLDVRWYAAHHRGWLMRHVKVSVSLWPCGERLLRGQTWVCLFAGARSARVYQLWDAEQERLLLEAEVEWVFVDLERRRPVEIPHTISRAFEPLGPSLRLPLPPEPPEGEVINHKPWVVGYTDLDAYGHVNNVRWVAWWTEHAHQLGLEGVPDRWWLQFYRPAQDGEQLRACSVCVAAPGLGRFWRWLVRGSGEQPYVELRAMWLKSQGG
ncbi:MAG: thioesterase [Bacteroidota bacterium]|nr:thioesterase [Bacteroidota bacterium]MDW8137841.1 thioesterase [Bacteroidota bacterium]